MTPAKGSCLLRWITQDQTQDRNRRHIKFIEFAMSSVSEVVNKNDNGKGAEDGSCSCSRKWPRTSALLFGVVLPLFLLIAISLFFGYFLAMLEAPNEIDENNKFLGYKHTKGLENMVNQRIAEDLPYICACTFLRDAEQQKLNEEYEECLAEEKQFVESFPDFIQANNSSNTTSNSTISYCGDPIILEDLAIERTIQQIFVDELEVKCPVSSNLSIVQEIPFVCNSETKFPIDARVSVDSNELFASLKNCGEVANEISEAYRMDEIYDTDLSSFEVSFNWIRCSNDYEIGDIFNEIFNPFVNVTDRLSISVQTEIAVQTFQDSSTELYCQRLGENLGNSSSLNLTLQEALEARRDAFYYSMENANGFTQPQCKTNFWAGGWFWFTIMTTIGYGNTAPVTAGGRAMIYTFGFLSLLVFGVFLAKSGSVVVTIIDDWLKRRNLEWLTWPSIQASVFGVLYYLWILLIASYYIYWIESGPNDSEISVSEAYWFAYITTTTIGLGDYYLEHAVIAAGDLITWPLLILFGFVLLSAFLNNLGDLLASFFGSTRSLAEILAKEEQLPWRHSIQKTTGMNIKPNSEDQHQSNNDSPHGVDGINDFLDDSCLPDTGADDSNQHEGVYYGDSDDDHEKIRKQLSGRLSPTALKRMTIEEEEMSDE